MPVIPTARSARKDEVAAPSGLQLMYSLSRFGTRNSPDDPIRINATLRRPLHKLEQNEEITMSGNRISLFDGQHLVKASGIVESLGVGKLYFRR